MERGGKCVCDVGSIMRAAGNYGDDLCGDTASYAEKWGGVLAALYDGDGVEVFFER